MYRPLVTGPNVIAGSEEKNLCAFDRASGNVQWCRSVGQIPPGLGSPPTAFFMWNRCRELYRRTASARRTSVNGSQDSTFPFTSRYDEC